MVNYRFAPMAFLLILISCKGRVIEPLEGSYLKLRSVPQEAWDSLGRKKIYFGHQSVGQNIIQGLEQVLQSLPTIRLEICETDNPGDFNGPVFAHSRIGNNRDPKGKIDHFRRLLESGIGQTTDIAFFKLCYVDVDQSTNIDDLLAYYDKALADLGQMYPKLVIIPVTLPLTNATPGIKARIKRFFGRGPALKADNIKRNIANDHIRRKYGARIWDLADAEATTADGAKVSFLDSRGTFFFLNPVYTSDGGHLNAVGSQVVAIDLLLRLASLDPY